MKETTTPVTVLAVLASSADRQAFGRIIGHSHWVLRFAENLHEAHRILRDGTVGVVVSDCEFIDGTWKDLLVELNWMPAAPKFIVTDHRADERLWAEALNLGAYDVLVQPFDATEVLRVVSVAWQSWTPAVKKALQRRPAASAAQDLGAPIPSTRQG